MAEQQSDEELIQSLGIFQRFLAKRMMRQCEKHTLRELDRRTEKIGLVTLMAGPMMLGKALLLFPAAWNSDRALAIAAGLSLSVSVLGGIWWFSARCGEAKARWFEENGKEKESRYPRYDWVLDRKVK